MPSTPAQIAMMAIERGEMEKLLLGSPEYRYRSRHSPSPGSTDLTEVLAPLYDAEDALRERARDQIVNALCSLSCAYEGIDPMVTLLVIEAMRKSSGRRTLEIPLHILAGHLRRAVETHRHRLMTDRSGGGADWPDGMLGEMKRLSRIVVDYGGPAFIETA